MAWKCFHQNKLAQLSIVRGPLVITFCFYSFENQNTFSCNSGKHAPFFLLVLLYDSSQPFIHSFLNLSWTSFVGKKKKNCFSNVCLISLFKIPSVNTRAHSAQHKAWIVVGWVLVLQLLQYPFLSSSLLTGALWDSPASFHTVTLCSLLLRRLI